MTIDCIIVEDEPLAVKKLSSYIQQIGNLRLLTTLNNAVDALNFLKDHSVDLIFLDVRMKQLSGIKFLEILKNKPKVIITSAYEKYALKGYELEVSDYLLKPFSFDRFVKAVDKVCSEFNSLNNRNFEPQNNCIFVKTEYRIERVEIDKILYIRGMKDYLQIVSKDKKIMTLQSFKNISEMLPARNFVRVHNSYIIAIDKIETIERNRIKIEDVSIGITEGYKEEFYKLMREKKYLL